MPAARAAVSEQAWRGPVERIMRGKCQEGSGRDGSSMEPALTITYTMDMLVRAGGTCKVLYHTIMTLGPSAIPVIPGSPSTLQTGVKEASQTTDRQVGMIPGLQVGMLRNREGNSKAQTMSPAPLPCTLATGKG